MINMMFKSLPYFFMEPRSHWAASRQKVSYCPTRSLLDVSRRFGKRDGDSLCIASSRLENENAVSRCLETKNQSDARFGTYGCFPMACEV